MANVCALVKAKRKVNILGNVRQCDAYENAKYWDMFGFKDVITKDKDKKVIELKNIRCRVFAF